MYSVAGEWPRQASGLSHGSYPSSSLALVFHSAMKRNAFSFGGCGANVSSQSTGSRLTLAKAWTHPTAVHSTSPGRAV